jgi:Rieske Fe-S protein
MNPDPSSKRCQTDRRGFLLLAASAMVAASCETVAPGGNPATGNVHVTDAGPALAYHADGVYSQYRDLGFFVVSRGGKLTAMTSICTHRRCKLEAEPDHSFSCPCHGSTFDATGHVTEGPATRDLPVFATAIDGRGHLMVSVVG